MPRQRKGRIYWRNGRAWGDFRDYSDVGGDREALKARGEPYATKDPAVAEKLAAERVQELEAKRHNRAMFGIEGRVALQDYVSHHLKEKARQRRNEDGVTLRWVAETQHHLERAIEFFGADRDMTTITSQDVERFQAWLSDLPNRRGGTLASSTVRHHLNALSNLFRWAVHDRKVASNPVADLPMKPSPAAASEADWLELPEAALFLEAARAYRPEPNGRGIPPERLHALIGTFLLTGGRRSEVLGLQAEDVSFDRNNVTFRPNEYRRLKTRGAMRPVPLWPQLREILQRYLFEHGGPTSGLLFPSRRGGMLKDLRKALDAVAEIAGFGRKVRAKMFRHTYTAARLLTYDVVRGEGGEPVRVSVDTYSVSRELGHTSTAMVERVYAHVNRDRRRSEVVEYRVEHHAETLGERLAAVRAKIAV